MKSLPRVRDHMDTVVPTLRPDTEIHAAIRFLIANKVTGAPVTNEQNEVVGMVTEYDCLRLIAQGLDAERATGYVRDYMTTEVNTIPPGMDCYYVAGLFLANRFRRFPVVEDGKLVGAITRFDILRVVQDRLG